jgi:hypothetical protein
MMKVGILMMVILFLLFLFQVDCSKEEGERFSMLSIFVFLTVSIMKQKLLAIQLFYLLNRFSELIDINNIGPLSTFTLLK